MAKLGDGGVIKPMATGGMLGAWGRWVFALFAGGLYLLGLAAQWLTAPMVLAALGLWPFLLAQILLIGLWYGLHAWRLRDAGRGTAAAQGVAGIHILAIVLLVLVGAFYMEGTLFAVGREWMPESFVLVLQLVTFSRGGDLLTLLGLVGCAALLVPPII
jgi:hypothetical protein